MTSWEVISVSRVASLYSFQAMLGSNEKAPAIARAGSVGYPAGKQGVTYETMVSGAGIRAGAGVGAERPMLLSGGARGIYADSAWNAGHAGARRHGAGLVRPGAAG